MFAGFTGEGPLNDSAVIENVDLIFSAFRRWIFGILGNMATIII